MAWVGDEAWIGIVWVVRWRTGSELIHGGRDGLGLDDEGERKKMRRKKEERREAGEREKERKDKIFF